MRKSLISAFSQKLYKKGKKNVFGSNFGEFSKISSVLAWFAAPLAEDSPFWDEAAESFRRKFSLTKEQNPHKSKSADSSETVEEISIN